MIAPLHIPELLKTLSTIPSQRQTISQALGWFFKESSAHSQVPVRTLLQMRQMQSLIRFLSHSVIRASMKLQLQIFYATAQEPAVSTSSPVAQMEHWTIAGLLQEVILPIQQVWDQAVIPFRLLIIPQDVLWTQLEFYWWSQIRLRSALLKRL